MLRSHKQLLLGAAALTVLLATAAWTSAADGPAKSARKPAVKLLAEGDELADKKDYAAAVVRYKEAYEQLMPDLRGRKLLEPVKPQLMTREELKKHMTKLIAEDFTDDELREMDRTLKAFRLVPREMDIKATMTSLLTEEVGGFYNPKDKAMVLIREGDEPKKKRGLFSRLLGGEPKFDKDGTKITLAHEMTHAVQDQYFDLEALDKAVEHDEDMSLALTALVEGDATLVMFAEMLRDDEDPKNVLDYPPAAIDAAFGVLRAMLPLASGKTFQKSPLILRESLIFPYHKGTVFVLHLTNDGGWERVDKAFRSPPVSTEQILHPEKFYDKDQLDEPTEIKLPDLTETVGKSWKPVGGDVLGEFQTTILLADGPASTRQAQVAAAGWDGDRYEVFESDGKQLGLVWVTTWDSPKDAEEFAAAYANHRAAKLAPKPAAGEKAKDKPRGGDDKPAPLRIEREGRVYVIQHRGDDVAVIEGFSPEITDKLLAQTGDAKKSPKRFKPVERGKKP